MSAAPNWASTQIWASREVPPACSPDDAWSVVRRSAMGVAVITTGSGPAIRGTTVSSFALAARTPPIVSVSLRADSAALMQLKEEESFTVNLLGRGQAGLARHFAAHSRACGLDRPGAEAWCHGIGSGPALRGAIGWLDCRTRLVIPVGDHELVIARVCAAIPGSGTPLVQQDGVLR
jgi:flavin reductase (DIM6/NTAB) family NADH-FMN oxidoreductase RutF